MKEQHLPAYSLGKPLRPLREEFRLNMTKIIYFPVTHH